MNIFATYPCPLKSAQVLDDKRVIKMILESTQLLCNALTAYGYDSPYKPTHVNHPCSVWTRQSLQNAMWLYQHALALSNEYTLRYNKVHKCALILKSIFSDLCKLPKNGFTDFANCAKRADLNIDYTSTQDVNRAYRRYLLHRYQIEYGNKRISPKYFRSTELISVRLEQIEANDNEKDFNIVEGVCHNLPSLNSRFFMYTDKEVDEDVKFVLTDKIVDIYSKNGDIIFKTASSMYSMSITNREIFGENGEQQIK